MAIIYRWYATLVEAKATSRITTSTPETELKRLIATASRRLERECGGGGIIRAFIPYIATKYYDYKHRWLLNLKDDLLDLTQLVNGDGSVWDSDDYFLYLRNEPPYRYIEPNRAKNPFDYGDTPQQAIQLTGKWGFCDRYEASGDAIQDTGGIDADATALTVSDGTLFSVGRTLLVEDEQMFVLAITNHTLTIVRAQNGTTAVAHAKDTAISIFRPPEDIALACKILVSRWYQEEMAGWAERTGVPGAGFPVTRAIPDVVKEMISPYVRYVGSVW